MAINILIADDHSLIRAGLRALLQAVSELNVIGEAENGYTALSRIAELRPDIVLMDISLPGMSGIEVTRQVRGMSPGTRVLMLTVHEDEGMLRESIRAGAHGYILKQAADAELIQAIHVVSQGHMYIYPTLTSALVKDLSPHKASPEPAFEALTRPCQVELHTDSEYLRQGITEWLPKWQRNGWRTAGREPVKNRDLWERLDQALAGHQVAWHWVKGHAGHKENERADRLANQGIPK